MKDVRAEEARRFFEEDEDPSEVFAAFDAAEKGRTSPPAQRRPGQRLARWADKARHALAGMLRKTANTIDPPGMRAR
jgi:hypothetical protein